MSCKHARDWKNGHVQKSQLFWQKQYWEATLVTINSVTTINLHAMLTKYTYFFISICIFLITMGLFLNYLQKKSYFFHNEKDIINIRYIAVYLLSYVLNVCMI